MKIIRCKQCGGEFERTYGVTFNGTGTLYCDRCGLSIPVDFATNNFFDESCTCGGRFSAEALSKCPNCGKLVEESDTVEKYVM